MIIMGVTALMSVAGFPTPLNWFGTTSVAYGIAAYALLGVLSLVLAGATATGAIIGFFGRAPPDFAILAPVTAGTTFVLFGDFYSIIQLASTMDAWIFMPILLIFGVLGIGFIWSAFEWTFGRD